MRKTLNKLFSIFVILLLTINLTSCGNLFSGSKEAESDEPESKEGVEIVVFKGFLGLDSNLSSDFLGGTSVGARAADSRSAAPAPLNITSTSTDYEYYVTAVSEKHGTVSAVVDTANRTFEIGLQLGVWSIEAGVRTKGTASQKVLTDSFEVELVTETPTFSHSFYMKPVSGGSGSINLEMEVTDDITSVQIEGTNFETKTLTKENNKIVFAESSIATGTYNLRFTFFKGDNPVYSTVQTINVLAGFATTKWFGGTSTLIDSDGKFKITTALTNSWKNLRKEYYVSTDGSDKNTGGPLDPFATLKHAITLINDIDYGTTTVKIHIQDGIQETVSSSIDVNSGKKISIDVLSGTPALNRKVATENAAAFTGSMIKVIATAELSLDGLTIDGKNVTGDSCKGIENHGTLTLKDCTIKDNKGIGVESASDGIGTTILAGGVIKIENNTKNLNLGKNQHDSDTGVVIPVQITGTFSEGTSIGISSDKNPTRNNNIIITSGYSTYNTAAPTTFFTGDTYGIQLDDDTNSSTLGEVLLVPNVANIYNSLNDLNITFTINKRKFTPGTATEIIITPKITCKKKQEDGTFKDEDITATALADITWDIKLYLGTKTINGWSFSIPTFTIPTSASYDDAYTLVVYATYKGMTFNTEFILNDKSPFVQIDSYTWNSDSAALTPSSNVFKSGRTINIPALIACDHEATQSEYEKYCIYGGTQPSDTNGKGPNYPAYRVSWYDAIVYCNLRSRVEGLTPVYKMGTETNPASWSAIVAGTGINVGKYCGPSSNNDTWNAITFDQSANGWRLPTEAEWEYLARGENTNSYTYSGSNTIGDVAWYSENSGDAGGTTNKKTHEVKTKNANKLDLYDMSGNVWEWCWDWYTSSSNIGADTSATGPASGPYRVIRGGNWSSNAGNCEVSGRINFLPYDRSNGLGFRVVRNAE